MKDYEAFLQPMIGIAEELEELYITGAAQHAPLVESIIAGNCIDTQFIESVLDGLLDLACHPAGLKLFKDLCRYYYFLNPAATANYIWTYRDMWDMESI